MNSRNPKHSGERKFISVISLFFEKNCLFESEKSDSDETVLHSFVRDIFILYI